MLALEVGLPLNLIIHKRCIGFNTFTIEDDISYDDSLFRIHTVVNKSVKFV